MISFVDIHVQMALAASWRDTLAGDGTAFRAIFNSMLDDNILLEVWSKIGNEKGVTFRSVWTPTVNTESGAIIAVELAEENLHAGFAADAFQRPTTTEEQWNMVLDSLVHIYVWSTDKDIVRVLHSWVKAAILAQKSFFFESGCDGVFYAGGADIGPERRLLPDGGNSYLRMQRWRFLGVEHLMRPGGSTALPLKPVLVHDVSALVGSYRNAETHETTQLADTLPGGLTPTE